jgi:hypothetical protein
MRAFGRGFGRGAGGQWFLTQGWAVGSSLLAWVMANLLDVFSVLAMVQGGGRMAWARHHPAEALVIYGLLRLLLTLAVSLGVASAARRWPRMARSIWGALTLCALVKAAAAWWRLYG